MVGKTEASFYQIGLEFIKFLEKNNQTSITNRTELSEIYNQKFKSRNPGTSYPSFGSVLHGLKMFNRITKEGDDIFFKFAVADRRSHRVHQPRHYRNGAASRPTFQGLAGAQDQTLAYLKEELKTNRAEFISDKNGIRITSDHPFEDGKLCLCVDKNEERVVNLKVENTGTAPVHFNYTPLDELKYVTLKDVEKVTKTNPLCLDPGHSNEIQVLVCCRYVGFYPATLVFEFKPDDGDVQTSPPFYIMCSIEPECITALGRELAPTAPYKRRSRPAWTPEQKSRIVDGRRPEGRPDMQLQSEVELKEYEMPLYMKELIHLLKSPTFHSKASHSTLVRMARLKKQLCWQYYSTKFHQLLYLEEIQQEEDIKKFNIPNDEREEATMTRDPLSRHLLILEVPGVSENRPSVLHGDALLVYPVGEEEVKYRGYVHSVQRDSLKLGFNQKFLNRFEVNMKFKVEFSFSRLTLRLQHRAAELAVEHRLGKVLFPVAPAFSQHAEPCRLSLFNPKLESNPEQYQAVQHIVAGSSIPAPYLVFGPPGTGKTVTLVESIKQIEKTQPSCHILACAPCNDATNLLCLKILEDGMDKCKVFRMYAKSCNPQSVPENLKACSNLEGEDFNFPAKEKLMEYKIMVTTLYTAGRLITGNIPEGHFTHVFVDEAGQAVETECLIPLAGLLHPETGQVVLAGDPKQLGPITRSSFAAQYGLGMSLLERMMILYQEKKKDRFNKRFVTKLLHNYRSHPAILKIPNELFYDGELLVSADEKLRNSCCEWEELPQKDFPVIFHSVYGVEAREASSPSYFNVAEVEVLMDYLVKLMKTSDKRGMASISPSEIGIITPYRKQVQKIRKALDKVGKDLKFKDMSTLKVGTVEEFQGQERKVIMVSTVRSKFEQFNLGFVKNEKRFNVAVTRAQALLIVVGNPTLLTEDHAWKQFISYCLDEGGHVPKEENDNLAMYLAALSIDNEAQRETTESGNE